MKSLLCLFFTIVVSASADDTKSTRIFGGYFAEENQFPHQIGIFSGPSFVCGGAIINERFILTAGHCVQNDAKSYKIMVGSTTIDPPGDMYDVKEKYIHDKYYACVLDIAVLELEKPLIFSQSVAPIEIFNEEIPVGEKVIISGWGDTGTGGSNKLKYVEVEIGEPKTCENSHPLFKNEYVLCLGHKVGTGCCMGDSGGPAIYKGKLVGEAICVVGGCGSQYPDGYQKVSYFLNWIKIIAFQK